MKKISEQLNLNEEILSELPLMFRYPTIKPKNTGDRVSVVKSNFYNTNMSICYPSHKPVSKILSINEKTI